MRIVQVTDLHIGQQGEDTFGVDVRANCINILRRARELSPDLLVISGDLCFRDPHPEIYRWVKNQIDATGLPYELLSGNHDDPQMLATIFERREDLCHGELFFKREYREAGLLFFDTTTGILSEQQQKWGSQMLRKASSEKPLTIFMHHPPVHAGVPYMDQRHAMKNSEAFLRLLQQSAGPLDVFAGHYHVDKTVRVGRVNVHITPSCFFQIDQHSAEFKVDHKRIGLREIVYQGAVIRHGVHYLEPVVL